jgi:adenine-specific DNA-methyltransferase
MLINFKSPYLTENIITYIGNKRKLLIEISDVVDDIVKDNQSFTTCLDAFSGSGIVSRLLRLKGFTVYANDLEDYTLPINRAFLTLTSDPLTETDYEFLNSVNTTTAPYFSKHYAPKNTTNPDLINERLFYSNENAVFIDGVLEQIHHWKQDKKDAVLANLLYKMSKNINTSGVMKGFYNGFGGPAGQNLGRILGKIQIDPIHYIDKPIGGVLQSKAEELYSITNCSAVDITYLDPPYNGHQYSSNYHLLNSAVKYDFYDPGPTTAKKSKVGIRKDHNRSEFCYKDRAQVSFETMFKNIQSKYLIISYNNEGILSIKEIEDLLKTNFLDIKIISKDYKKFAGGYGGYQNTVNNKVQEFFIVAKSK